MIHAGTRAPRRRRDRVGRRARAVGHRDSAPRLGGPRRGPTRLAGPVDAARRPVPHRHRGRTGDRRSAAADRAVASDWRSRCGPPVARLRPSRHGGCVPDEELHSRDRRGGPAQPTDGQLLAGGLRHPGIGQRPSPVGSAECRPSAVDGGAACSPCWPGWPSGVGAGHRRTRPPGRLTPTATTTIAPAAGRAHPVRRPDRRLLDQLINWPRLRTRCRTTSAAPCTHAELSQTSRSVTTRWPRSNGQVHRLLPQFSCNTSAVTHERRRPPCAGWTCATPTPTARC